MKTVAEKQAQYIDYRKLEPFQGNLKDLSAENYNKLLKSFKDEGFFVPVYVWKHKGINYLLDGHGRKRVLDNEKIEFENTGFEIPCYYIPGDNFKQAKMRLLRITSQFQTITQEGIDEFIAEAELDEAEVLEATSFDATRFQHEEEPNVEVEEDEAPEVSDEPPVSKLGEVYQLGRWVYCPTCKVKHRFN